MNNSKNFKRGGVSLFVVIITCVLIAVLTASFVRLMLRDQQQASKQDLSQSAYDSAQAGVEDAKRFLNIYNSECAGGDSLVSERCQRIANMLNNPTCNTLSAAGIGSATGETQVQTTSGDVNLNQAYTCVKIQKNTPNYLGKSTRGVARTIPLRGTENFSSVLLKWHSEENLTNKSSASIILPSNTKLPGTSTWSANTNAPAVMKAQFFGYTSSMSDASVLDGNFSDDGNGLDEVILFPSKIDLTVNLPTARRQGSITNDVSQIKCETSMPSGGYACQARIKLGHTVTPGNLAYLRLTPLYNDANFEVQLLNNTGAQVQFNGVQPKVDSTGRANEQYRRVESRLELTDANFPVPDFAVQVEGDAGSPLCKNLFVTRTTQQEDCKL